MNDINDLLADGRIAALHFHTGAASRSTRAFVGELANVLSATPKKPLIATSDNGLTALYRFFQLAQLRTAHGRDLTMSGGRRFSDIEGYAGHAYIEVQFAGDDRNTITLPDGGRWTDGRTPATVSRHDLPVFDSARVSRDLEALLDRWAGKLVDIELPAVEPKKSWAEPVYADERRASEPTRTDRFTPGQREAMKYLGIE